MLKIYFTNPRKALKFEISNQCVSIKLIRPTDIWWWVNTISCLMTIKKTKGIWFFLFTNHLKKHNNSDSEATQIISGTITNVYNSNNTENSQNRKYWTLWIETADNRKVDIPVLGVPYIYKNTEDGITTEVRFDDSSQLVSEDDREQNTHRAEAPDPFPLFAMKVIGIYVM